jgi:hypothetical protein
MNESSVPFRLIASFFLWISLYVQIQKSQGCAICKIRTDYVASTQDVSAYFPEISSSFSFLNFWGYTTFGIFSHGITLEWKLYEDRLHYWEY